MTEENEQIREENIDDGSGENTGDNITDEPVYIMDDPVGRLIVIIIAGIIIGLLLAIAFPQVPPNWEPGDGGNGSMAPPNNWHNRPGVPSESVYIFNTIILTTNLLLAGDLLMLFYIGYLETKADFMLGLTIFMGLLFANTLLALPILRGITLFAHSSFAYFSFMPSIMMTGALSILNFLTRR